MHAFAAADSIRPAPLAAEAERVAGWDFLRGLCAIAVALYHLLYWQGIASLHTLGSYGVYLFFILSGASLAYTYGDTIRRPADYGAFLATRWLRLAPLYLILCAAFLAMLAARNGQPVDQLTWRSLLNASFLFGVIDPAVWAILIGGWSLGIEFFYYLAFPLLMAVVGRPGHCLAMGLALALLQGWWIVRTAGSDAGYAASAVAYHQLPAFAAYFFAGCVIGHWRRQRDLQLAPRWGLFAWTFAGTLLLALNPAEQGDELLGWRGLILPLACVAVVAASGQVRLRGLAASCARWLGDITYGCYLLHPLIFFGFAWFLLPRWWGGDVEELPLVWRLATVLAVLVLSCTLARVSERWFESPLRRWGKRVLARLRVAGKYRESPRIAS